MILYASYKDYLAFCDIANKRSGVLKGRESINNFFSENKDIFIAWNGEQEKKRYPRSVILSCFPEETFITYCAQHGLNCSNNDDYQNRCTYEVNYLLEHYGDTLKPIVSVYVSLWERYKMDYSIFSMNDYGLLNTVLGWR